MPRSNRQAVDSNRPLEPSKREVGTPGVTARYVDTFVSPAMGQTQALMDGLAVLNPALSRYTAYKDMNEENEGAAARQQGAPKDDSKGGAWARGYLSMDNTVKGQQDASTVTAAYDAWEGKDGGNIEEFLSTQVGALTKGLRPDDIVAYNKGIGPQLNKLRTMHLDYTRKQLLDRSESNAMALLENGVRGYISSGQPVPDEFIEGYKGELNKMGVSNSRFNDLLFGSVKRLGDEGNPGIYDMFKRPRPDGTPGMYNIPAWKEKIDQAQLHAQTVFVAKAEKADTLARKAREERQETALFSVFDLLTNGDEAGARQQFNLLRQDRTLFSRASDVVKWEKLFTDTAKREARPEQEAAASVLIAGAVKGTIGPDHVLRALSAGTITNQQARAVLTDLSKIRSEQSQAASAARSADNQAFALGKRIFQTPEFKSGEDYISGVLRSQANGLTDPFGNGTVFEQQQRAAAKLEFTRRAQGITNPAELNAVREEIADRYLKRRKEFNEKALNDLPNAGLIRYSTEAAAAAGLRSGHLTLEEAMVHDQFFDARKQRGTKKP